MSLAFRAFFALPDDLATTDGTVTNAVHGFAGMLVYLIREHRPSGIAVAFDLAAPTFRDEILPDYKAGRSATPDILLPQFDMIRDFLRDLAIPVLEIEGFEADDVLATLATRARDRQADVIVVTGDRDCFQLVEDPHVKVLYNRRGVSDYSLYDEAGILERTGVGPERYPVLASLRGDPSDNLPGVPGVGEKTAAKLVSTYGDLDALFAHLDELSPKLRSNLAEHEAQVRANLAVIPLRRDVPIEVAEADLALGGWDGHRIQERCEQLELKTVWGRLRPLLVDGSVGAPVPGGALDGDSAEGATDRRAVEGAPPGDEPEASTEVSVQLERPTSADEALQALPELQSAAGQRPVAVIGRWEGEPGRSLLEGVALVVGSPETAAPPAGEGGPSHRGVWVEAGLLGDGSLAAGVSDLLSGPASVVSHEFKELLRSVLPMGIDATSLAMDTSVAAYLLDPSSGRYGLANVAAGEHLGQRAPEHAPGPTQLALDTPESGAEPAAGGEDRALAAAIDAATVDLLVPRLRRDLDREGLSTLHDEIECPLVRVLARMEVAGIRVDREELDRIATELVDEAKQLEEQVHVLAGHEFNVNSTPQLRTVLYEELGLAPQRKTKTGYSTDAATLERLRDAHPIVATLLRYREVEKLRSTYGTGLLAEVAEDGRIHASFRQTVARTGRISSERPNLHNIPVRTESGRRFRRAFVPADGCVLLVADYDQIELRVLAHLADDPGLRGAFESGADVHRTVASGVYGIPPEEVTTTQREYCKMVSYGLAYGMEAYGLSQRLSTGVDEANEIIDRYFLAFPRVRAYMDDTVREARLAGETRTALGRRRPLPELHDRNFRIRHAAERQAMNAGIQGLAADIFKTALVRLDALLEARGGPSRLVLQVHDEVLVEVERGEEEEVGTLTRSALEQAAELSVPLKVSMAWGASWAQAKGG